jgi:hypothetical protein
VTGCEAVAEPPADRKGVAIDERLDAAVTVRTAVLRHRFGDVNLIEAAREHAARGGCDRYVA